MKCRHCSVQIQPICPSCKGVIPSIDIARTKLQQDTFHKLVGSYARQAGISAAKAKVMMKYLHGVSVPLPFRDGELPPWSGRPWEIYPGTTDHCFVFLKSEADYNVAEEKQLIDGTYTECFDIGADIEWFEKLQEEGL